MKTDREKLIALIKEANLSMWGRSGISSAAERRAYLADYLISKGVTIPVRCSECRYNVANMKRDPLDATDYTDIVCSYFMTDGIEANDFCSHGERKEE